MFRKLLGASWTYARLEGWKMPLEPTALCPGTFHSPHCLQNNVPNLECGIQVLQKPGQGLVLHCLCSFLCSTSKCIQRVCSMPSTVLRTGNAVASKAQTPCRDPQGSGGDREGRPSLLYNFIGVSLKDNKLRIFEVIQFDWF